jgi:hypothetical protein
MFFLTKPHIGLSSAAMLMVVLMLPFFFLAMYEKDGMPAEKIAGNLIKTMFLKDRVRPYRTNNFYAAIEREMKEQEELDIEQRQYKAKRSRKRR